MNLFAKLSQKFDDWMMKRYYEKRHLEYIQTTIQNDLRWLSVHPVGKELLERYDKLVSPDWYKYENLLEDVGSLRRRLGWCPHEQKE